jgi:hypothetical protein
MCKSCLSAVSAIGRKQAIGAKRKATPWDGFGNNFGNRAVVIPQTLVIPIDLAERVGFEPTVPLTVRLISSQVHSTTLPPLRTELQL